MEVLNSLGALGFWIFIAAIVVAGIWSDTRKREIQQETLRRIVESGKDIDAAMLDKLIAAGRGDARPDKDLKTSGIIMLFIAPGLVPGQTGRTAHGHHVRRLGTRGVYRYWHDGGGQSFRTRT